MKPCVWAAAAVQAVCKEYKVHNADIFMKEDCDIDDLVIPRLMDVIMTELNSINCLIIEVY